MGGRRMSEEKLLEGTEERREKELSSIDRLFQDIRQYCTGAEFMKKLGITGDNFSLSFKNIKMDCGNFFAVEGSDKYALKDFSFENIDCKDNAKKPAFKNHPIDGLKLKNVVINGEMKTEN
jgi:hypothetical protein